MSDFKYLYLVLGIDVEEEGLFSGRYECRNPQIHNTACLDKLTPLIERGARPTLFCAYTAFADMPSRKMLEHLRDDYDVEIGAHLHHWNTPPFENESQSRVLFKVPAKTVPNGLMDDKLRDLFQMGNTFQGAPITSFRMGRWDMNRQHWPLLRRHGVLCDASVRPFHAGSLSAPDHFKAPVNPYRIDCGVGEIFEVPATVTPILPALARACEYSTTAKSSFSHWGALALLPVEHPLWLMKLTTRLYAARGGTVLTLNWHSSEMMPGGSPRMRDEAAVNRFLAKIASYLEWLDDTYIVTFATMDELRRQLAENVPLADPNEEADWATTGGLC